MSHALPSSPDPGGRMSGLIRGRRLGRWLRAWGDRLKNRPFVAAWQAVAVITFTFTVLAGVSVRLTDPQSIPSTWDGMWWAVQTVTTVGYGDTIPRSSAGRIIATGVMMFGIAFLTVTAAAIGSLFNDSARRHRERHHEDPVQEEVARLHSRLDEIVAELHRLRSAVAAAHPEGVAPPGVEAERPPAS